MARKKLVKLTRKQVEALELPVSELALSLRTVNALEKASIFNVEALLSRSAEELLVEVSNFGEKSLDEVYAALAPLGFHRNTRRKKRGKKSNK